MTDEQFAKLPKWAQQEFQGLRNDVAHWERQAHEAANVNPGDTDTLLSGYRLDHDKGLPKGATVRFILGSESEYISVNVKDGVLHVNGCDSITIEPRASNDIQIRMKG